MPRDLESRIRAYAEMVEILPQYEEWDEALNVLITRDLIDRDLQEHKPLSPEVISLLEAADARLVEHRSLLLRRFPEVFEANQSIPAKQWWWHLDKGPQVRKQARGAA